jgi:hypothetical protein
MDMLKPIKPLPVVPARVVYSVKLPSGARFTQLAPGVAHNVEAQPECFRVVKVLLLQKN